MAKKSEEDTLLDAFYEVEDLSEDRINVNQMWQEMVDSIEEKQLLKPFEEALDK